MDADEDLTIIYLELGFWRQHVQIKEVVQVIAKFLQLFRTLFEVSVSDKRSVLMNGVPVS